MKQGYIYMQEVVFVRKKTKSKERINTKKPPHPKHTTKSRAIRRPRRHATKHVPRVSPYSPASIDPGFVEIGFGQLSQSVKTTNATHIQTEGQTE